MRPTITVAASPRHTGPLNYIDKDADLASASAPTGAVFARTRVRLVTQPRMSEPASRLHSLDALRGVAAVSVVFWHWQHLRLLGTPKLTWPPLDNIAPDPMTQPFHQAFLMFYRYGYSGVDLFFLISGFIFFWLYRDKLQSGR